jgi:hypothetical protein
MPLLKFIETLQIITVIEQKTLKKGVGSGEWGVGSGVWGVGIGKRGFRF